MTQATVRRRPSTLTSADDAPRSWWRRRWVIVLAASAAAVVLGLAVWWVVYRSPLLTVRSVEVVGATAAVRDQATTAANVTLGDPLATVPLDAVRSKVLTIPDVASVTVRRSWPHTITISIVAEQPVAAMRTTSNGFALVSASGLPYRTVTARPHLPLITNRLGTSSTTPTTTAAAAVAAALCDATWRHAGASSSLSSLVATIHVAGPQHIVIKLRNGRTVAWGSPTESALKAEVLRMLLRATPGAHSYDVSAPRSPAVVPASG